MRYKDKSLFPSYFKFSVSMLTRTRYRCAGWFVLSHGSDAWAISVEPVLKLDTKEYSRAVEKSGYSSLNGALWAIVQEWCILSHEVKTIESENE